MAYNPDLINFSPADTLYIACQRINSNLQEIASILNAYPEAASIIAFMASKGQANGLASLTNDGKIPQNQLPAITINDTFVVASEAAMLALTAERGDIAIRTDQTKTYVLAGDDPSILANWKEILTPASAVQSVDGRTGAVTLGDLYQALSQKGQPNGYASLNSSGNVVQEPASKGQSNGIASLDANSKVIQEPASKGQANGIASLDTNSRVIQEPANATATPTASKIPIADASGKLDSWISDASSATKGKIQLTGQLAGTADAPQVIGIKESGGQALSISSISDGQILKRSGTNITGETRYRYVTLTVDGGASAITTGDKGWWVCDVTGTIIEWTLLANTSGSIVIDIWKNTYANFPPTSANTITGSAKPTLSSAQKAQSSTLTGWTTAVNAGDILKFNVDSVATVQRITLTLKIQY